MKIRTSVLLGAMLIFVLAGSLWAHIGITKFMPEVPDPGAMTMDGDEKDWGWMDPSFAITMDQMVDFLAKEVPREDYNVAFFTAWSPPPDNSFYFFARIADDTLRVAEEDVKRWWNDDMLQLSIDADHSGGPYLGENLDEVANGQRYHLRVLPLPGQSPTFLGALEFIDVPELAWGHDPEWFDVASVVLPAGAANMSTNVTYTFEIKAALWDYYGTSPGESQRHIFAPEGVIHLGVRFDDGDGGEAGEKHLVGLKDATLYADRDGDQAPDFIPLDTVEGPTAVEQESWGRIKSYLNQQLR